MKIKQCTQLDIIIHFLVLFSWHFIYFLIFIVHAFISPNYAEYMYLISLLLSDTL